MHIVISFLFILTAKLSNFLPLLLCGLVVCGEMTPTSGSSSSLSLFSCWNMGMCGSVSRCCFLACGCGEVCRRSARK